MKRLVALAILVLLISTGPTAAGTGTFSGARVSNSVSLTSGVALTYDTIVYEQGGAFRTGTTAQLCAPIAGYYQAGLTITTLGTAYGKPSNADVQLIIQIAGSGNDGQIVYIRERSPGSSAELHEAISLPVFLAAGTCLESFVYPTGRFIEANWAGFSNLSPVFALWLIGT